MNANPMEEQIGRLVGNLLAGGGEIFLPGVGSLYTERQGARRLNRRTVLPPSRTVAFTSQQRGVSLVDEIARVMREAGGYENPEAEAQAVYDRWIARVHRADLLTVEGVGELKFKNFIPDEAFDLRLNPQGREPVRVRVREAKEAINEARKVVGKCLNAAMPVNEKNDYAPVSYTHLTLPTIA